MNGVGETDFGPALDVIPGFMRPALNSVFTTMPRF